MVMITRSAYKRACESSDISSLSQNNIIPPWCSSGKVFARKRTKVSPSTWEIQSAYPLRENIWEYLREGKVEPVEQSVIRGKRRRQCNCKQRERKANCKSAAMLCALVIIALGLMASIWVNHIPKINLLTKHRDKLVSLLSVGRTEVAEECCHTMRHLASQLAQIQHKLRHTLRVRRTMMISTQIMRTAITEVDKKYIEDATVTKGSNTKEWGGQIALWGVVPLWRAAPPPDIVLAQRVPTPSDCWPFSGSSGELMIELSKEQPVRYVSLEHIRPDTAKSAPKQFLLYGILGNGTRVAAVEGEYYNKGPAKQYYPLTLGDSLKRLVFHVLSNHGNSKYTCIYRFHLYRDWFIM